MIDNENNHYLELKEVPGEYDRETFLQKISFPAFFVIEILLITFFLPEILWLFGYDIFELLGIH